MTDNTTLNPGVGGDVIRDLDRLSGGVRTQVMQIDVGGDSSQPESLVSASNPMPVAESGPLITLFIRLLNLLGAPVGYDKAQGRYRQTAIIESGTLTTVSTLTTMGNQTNIGGVQAQILVNGATLSAWQACVRARIT